MKLAFKVMSRRSNDLTREDVGFCIDSGSVSMGKDCLERTGGRSPRQISLQFEVEVETQKHSKRAR